MGRMPANTLLHWLGRRMLRTPVVWLAAAVLIGMPWLLLALGTIGLASDSSRIVPMSYELAFVGALFGCGTGLSALEELERFLAPLSPIGRASAQDFVLLSSTACLGLLPILPVLALGMGLAGNELALAAIGTLCHLVALGLLLLRLPWLRGGRAIALPIVAWFLPAVLPLHVPILASMMALLSPSAWLSIRAAMGTFL